MADSSWDNSGLPPEKPGMGTGTKWLLGCGVALGLLVVTCVGVPMVLGRMVQKDPEAFERKMESFAKGFLQEDWDRARKVVDALQTDESARLLYTQNPELSARWATSDAFLAQVREWRPRLPPLPAAVPEGDRGFSLTKTFGTTRMGYRYDDGTRLRLTFERDRLTTLEVR